MPVEHRCEREGGAVVVLAWSSPLGELGPAPDSASLSVSVRCRTRRGAGGRRHEVRIGPDWSVETPHDLAAERIGVALGGYLSCIELVDDTVPAARELLQLVARRVLPPLSRKIGRASCRERVQISGDAVSLHK